MPAVPEPPQAPIHLKPAAELAERVLLPGDPHRALLVAQELLEKPLMFNHQRGLWGYTGRAPDGELLTIQATGMGGPSAAIVVHELIGLGARRLIRIGTCGALAAELALGDLMAVSSVIPADGTSRALGATGQVAPDPDLTARLGRATGGRVGVAVSTDLFYDNRPLEGWREAGALAVEMEAAAVIQTAATRGACAACLLAVSDIVLPSRSRLGPEELEAAGLELGRAAFSAVAQTA